MARFKSFTEFLRFYREQGLSIIPIPYGKKEANIKWQVYQKRLPTDAEIAQWFNSDTTNIAIITGEISGNFVVIDCDSDEKYLELKSIIEKKLGLDNLENHTPVVKTGRGYHIWLRTAVPVKSTKFPRLDIKGEGGYIIAPPSVHPNGKQYYFVNPNVPDIFVITSLADIGIDLDQKPLSARKNNHWVSQALQGVPEGQRDDTCTQLAGYFLGQGILPAVVKTMLYPFAERCEQPPGKPFTRKDVDKTVDSVWRKENTKDNNLIGVNNNLFFNTASKQDLVSKRDNYGTTTGQDEGKEWGFYTQKFDEYMQEANGRVDKREVAEAIGLKVTDDTFRKILSRRKGGNKPQVRAYRGSHNLIEWINRDYKITPENIGTQAMLKVRLPLSIPECVKIPSRSVVGIAGYKSTGKTAFLLETAELNVYSQELPVYYWYNEMGELLLNTRLEDYPLLLTARREGRFRPAMQTTFEFTDVIDPDAINLIDYIDRDDDIWLIGEDIRKIFTPLNRGCSIFALQKKQDSKLGYGGTPTLKLATLYITLDEKYHSEKSTHGLAKIIVCKNWEGTNPVGLSCEYHTGGKHGKLFRDTDWKR